LVGAQVRWDKEITEPVKDTFFCGEEKQNLRLGTGSFVNNVFFFPACKMSVHLTFRQRYVISRVSGGLTAGERTEKKIRYDNNLYKVQ
jgi:hypothetical protein